MFVLALKPESIKMLHELDTEIFAPSQNCN